MKDFRILIVIFLLSFLPRNAFSSAERFKLLDTSNGLFNNQVRFLTQMEDGKILVYTEGMFNVYDGNRFEPLVCNLNHTLPLGMHNICTAYDGGNGLLWAKDYYRLYLIDTRTQRFCLDLKERFRASGLQEPLNDFILDRDKSAWLITASGKLYRYDWKNPAQLVYTPSAEEKKSGIKAKDVIQAGPFHLIFLNTGKMLCWEEKTGRVVGEDLTAANPPVPSEAFRTAWLQTDSQHLLISISHTEGYVYLYNIYTRQWKVVLKGIAINDIKKDRKGYFWLGGNNIIVKLSPQYEVVHKIDKLELPDGRQVQDFVMSLLIDNRQGLWVGTGSFGILKSLPKEHYVEYYANDAAAHDGGKIIRSLAPYDNRSLLAGTLQGIFLFDTSDKTFRPFQPEVSGLYCSNIQKDAQGRFWFCTRQGLFCLQNGQVMRKDRQATGGRPTQTVRFCLPLSDGKLLVCFNLKDLYLYDPEKEISVHLDEKNPELSRSRVMSFAVETQPGKLLIGGQNGLFEYDIAQNTIQPPAWIAPWEKYSIKYNCAYMEKAHVWIGTQNGLICHDYREGKTIRLDMENGLPNNCIQGITADTEGRLWVSTSNGVAQISPGKGNARFSVARLEAQDGVQPGEMMEQSIAAMPDGHVYVGGIKGITDIGPHVTDYPQERLMPKLVGLRVMNQPINNEGVLNGRLLLPEGFSYTRELRLEYYENFLELRFSALDYDTPQHTRYRYRLDGLDKNWNYTTEPTGICTATYTSLAPGTYTLHVQAAMGHTPWDTAVSEWQITILPPWWKTWWAYTLYIIAVLLAAYYVIELYLAYKRSRMEAEQENLKRQKEQQLDELKFRFFTNISHEFRTPLALIITPLELLIRNSTEETLKKELGKILGNAKELLKLVNQLLDFRRLEQKGERLKLSTIHPKSFFEECVDSFKELAREQHIMLTCDCRFAEEDTFNLDREKIVRVMNNLLSNAFKFTPGEGRISVEAEWQDEKPALPHTGAIHICVSDTGCGIKKEELEHIFDRFYQSENKLSQSLNTGSGIGLHLAKGYVDLHEGHIRVDSAPGRGTAFHIVLPWHSLTQDATAEEAAPQEGDAPRPQGTKGEGPQATILIVEDNTQFRIFMQDLLRRDYRIMTAEDGKEGLETAREHNPDLIISDVMMPRMDGYEFCRKIKGDMKCSHIPFILLTAKNSSESRSGAYDAGADSFIAKPFDIDVLSSRIRQLLEQERKRRERFRKELQVVPKDIAVTPIDEQLLERAVKCVEKNMGNAEYTVDQLSSDIGIERSVLWRKLQALVGQSPSEFIRSIRLKRAAELLETGRYSVQDISWKVGFNTPRYFSSYFKEMFGMTPSQYARKDKTNGS